MAFRSEQANVVLKNNVNINDTLTSGDYNAIYARSVKVAPNANVKINVRNTKDSYFLHGNAAIKVVGDGDEKNVAVEIGSAATFTINPDKAVENVKGILVEGNGDVILAKNADVEMNLGSGNSTGIWGARNLTLNEGTKLNIHTLQDNHGIVAWGSNNNGHHVSPISLVTNKVSWADNTLEIKKGASLKIVRENSGKSVINGLISFGSYSTNAHSRQNLIVDDGATLDLQDGAQADWHEYGDKLASYLGNYEKIATTGLINMYGIDATDNVHFGRAKYVNMQRTGKQHGILLRLEGGSSVTIDANKMPLKQWIEGNYSKDADFSWKVDYLKTESKWDDFSYTYNAKNQNAWVQNAGQRSRGITFDQSTGAVRFSDGKSLVYEHGDFNQKFNWWSPQRISFGSIYDVKKASVADSNALISHVNANVEQSPSLNTNKIVLTWTDDDGNQVVAPTDYTINWLNGPDTSSATDGILNRTGKVEITIDGEKQVVVVPVEVLSATVKNNGAKVDQNNPATLPSAGYMTNTDAVDCFGISKISWSREPDITKPNPEATGEVKVSYTDGTSQTLTPYVDVREVRRGEDYPNDPMLFRKRQRVTVIGSEKNVITVIGVRDRIINNNLDEDDDKHVVYGDWRILDTYQDKSIAE